MITFLPLGFKEGKLRKLTEHDPDGYYTRISTTGWFGSKKIWMAKRGNGLWYVGKTDVEQDTPPCAPMYRNESLRPTSRNRYVFVQPEEVEG